MSMLTDVIGGTHAPPQVGDIMVCHAASDEGGFHTDEVAERITRVVVPCRFNYCGWTTLAWEVLTDHPSIDPSSTYCLWSARRQRWEHSMVIEQLDGGVFHG